MEKFLTDLHDKIQLTNLKQTLNHKSVFKKVHKMLNFNQNAWLKPYVDANTDLRIKPKNNIETYFNNVIFGKTMQTVRKHKDIKLAIIERRKNYLVSKPNYHPIKLFTENLFEIEMRKIKVLMNKPSNLGFSILELSKILMCEFWYDYVKPKYNEKGYIDTLYT